MGDPRRVLVVKAAALALALGEFGLAWYSHVNTFIGKLRDEVVRLLC